VKKKDRAAFMEQIDLVVHNLSSVKERVQVTTKRIHQ